MTQEYTLCFWVNVYGTQLPKNAYKSWIRIKESQEWNIVPLSVAEFCSISASQEWNIVPLLYICSGILFNSLAQPSTDHRDEGWRRRRRRPRRRPQRRPQPQGHRVRRRGRSEICCRNCRFVSSFTFNLVFTKVGFFNLLYMIQS